MKTPVLSVVIGIRDWSLDRLALALQVHRRSTISSEIEIVVSDYGSLDAAEVRTVAEAGGARVIRTERDGPWSRSRALNIGIRAAETEIIVNTDADILFLPTTLEAVLEHLRSRPRVLHLVQCRDLPSDLDVGLCQDLEWGHFERCSVYRPRWGMGGLAAFHRDLCHEIHGYDERMEHHGSEDNDFGERARRAGHPINWIVRDDARIYHMWHPNAFDLARVDRALASGIAANRELRFSDDRYIRNYDSWGGSAPKTPLVSVVIVTHNRSDYLRESIRSVLGQTMSAFELDIIDDGSTDDTRAVVEGFADDRIRYVFQQQSGISVSRNRGVREARSPYLAILDDDDLFLPDSLERHVDALGPGVHGTFGAWIDFDNENGHMQPHPGNEFNYANLLFRGKTLQHSAVMMRTDVLRRFPYDEAKAAGSDYDMFLRMARAGLRMRHTGHVVTMRRLHADNITVTSPGLQKANSVSIARLFLTLLRGSHEARLRARAKKAEPVGVVGFDDPETFRRFLPEHLDTWHVSIGPFVDSEVAESAVQTIEDLSQGCVETYPSNTLEPGVLLVSKNGFSFTAAQHLRERVRARTGADVGFLSPPEVAPLFDRDRNPEEGNQNLPEDCLPARNDTAEAGRQPWLALGPVPDHSRALWIAQRLRILEGWDAVQTYSDSEQPPRLWIVTERLPASADVGALIQRIEAEFDLPVVSYGAE